MKCFFCDASLVRGNTLHRVNEKGVPGIWACNFHRRELQVGLDPNVAIAVAAIKGIGKL